MACRGPGPISDGSFGCSWLRGVVRMGMCGFTTLEEEFQSVGTTCNRSPTKHHRTHDNMVQATQATHAHVLHMRSQPRYESQG